MPVRELRGGQTASFSLRYATMQVSGIIQGFVFRKFKKKDIRKGMVIVAASLQPTACWEFDGEILVLHHPTTISPKYQAMGMNMSTGYGTWPRIGNALGQQL
jgi:GTPase